MLSEDQKYLREIKSFLVIDDHPVVRSGLSRVINQLTGGNSIVDEVASVSEALTAIRERTYDLIILDLKLGEESGIDLLKQLKQEKTGLKILVLSTFAEEMMGVEAIKHGALGYVCKDQVAERLQEAIIKVSQGCRYISQAVADGLMDAFNPKHLSERETDVLKGIGCGKSTKEIAKELGISDKTVSTYRERIQQKAGLTGGTNELIRYAIEDEKKCQK